MPNLWTMYSWEKSSRETSKNFCGHILGLFPMSHENGDFNAIASRFTGMVIWVHRYGTVCYGLVPGQNQSIPKFFKLLNRDPTRPPLFCPFSSLFFLDFFTITCHPEPYGWKSRFNGPATVASHLYCRRLTCKCYFLFFACSVVA